MDLARRYESAVEMLYGVEEQLKTIESNYKQDELDAMRAKERDWLEKVVHMDQHRNLENLYELGGGSGEWRL